MSIIKNSIGLNISTAYTTFNCQMMLRHLKVRKKGNVVIFVKSYTIHNVTGGSTTQTGVSYYQRICTQYNMYIN